VAGVIKPVTCTVGKEKKKSFTMSVSGFYLGLFGVNYNIEIQDINEN